MPKKILNLSESRESSIERNSEAESKISTGTKVKKRDVKLQKIVVKKPLNLKAISPFEVKLNEEDYQRLKEEVIQEVCKTLKLSIIELEEMTDFQKLIHNKIKRLAADVHGKASQTYAPYTTKSKDSKDDDLIDRSFEDHIIAPATTVRVSNGGGPMNQFYKNMKM